ncbi:RNA polymerase Rpb4-domain-containing protein [Pilaira anomala]|nr:RNA polymerase Rpb4-domain-containing protein [Pilaira anomala]
MLIKNVRSALISNYEVLKLLEESQEAQKQVQAVDPSVEYPEHLRTVQFELTEYLKGTPCSTQTPEQIANFLQALSKYELTKAEKLQILNWRPRSTVEIYLIIEECEERFSEEDLEEMLDSIISTLPRDDDEEEEEEEEGVEVEDEEMMEADE